MTALIFRAMLSSFSGPRETKPKQECNGICWLFPKFQNGILESVCSLPPHPLPLGISWNYWLPVNGKCPRLQAPTPCFLLPVSLEEIIKKNVQKALHLDKSTDYLTLQGFEK